MAICTFLLTGLRSSDESSSQIVQEKLFYVNKTFRGVKLQAMMTMLLKCDFIKIYEITKNSSPSKITRVTSIVSYFGTLCWVVDFNGTKIAINCTCSDLNFSRNVLSNIESKKSINKWNFAKFINM